MKTKITTKKVLIALGLGIVAYFIYKKLKSPSDENKTRPLLPNSYRLKKDFDNQVLYKKGQIIQGVRTRDPKMESIPFGEGDILTTTEGKIPDFESKTQLWVQIPESILERI